jgi:putative ABC transport system permease protein
MKKKALRKDFYIEIKKSLNRFLSIFFIVALGVSFFSGIQASAPDMRSTGDWYFDQNSLMDIRVISTLGLTQDDLSAIGDLEEIDQVNGCYMEDVYCGEGDSREVLHVESIPADMNVLEVEEGEIPTQDGECFLDLSYAQKKGYQVGDTLEITVSSEDDSSLIHREFTVAGIGYSPCYISFGRGSTTLGTGSVSGFLYVPAQEFDAKAYSVAYVLVKGAKEAMSFTDDYDTLVETAKDAIEEITDARCEIRYQEVIDEAHQTIEDAKQEVEDGKQKVADAKQELADGESEAQSELDEAESELIDGEEQIADAKPELNDARREVIDGWTELKDGENELISSRQELLDGKQQIADAKAQLEEGEAQYQDGLSEYNSQLSSATKQLKAAQKKIDSGNTQLKQGWEDYNTNLAKVEAGETQLQTAQATLEEQQSAYDAGAAQLAEGREQYNAASAYLPQLQEGYNEASTQAAQLQENYNAAKSGAEEAQSACDTITAGISSLTAAIDGMNQQIAALEAQLQAVQGTSEENADAAAQSAALEQQLAGLREQKAAQEQQLAQLQASLPEAQAGLQQAQSALEALQQGLSTAQQTAASLKQQIDTLTTTKQTLDQTEAQLTAASAQLTEGWKQIEASRSELATGRAELEKARAQLEENQEKLVAAQDEVDQGYAELNAAKAKLDAARKELDDGWQTLRESEEKLSDGEQQIADGIDQLEDGWKELADGKKELADGEKELAENQQKIKDGWKDYREGKQEADDQIAEGKQKIADAEQELADAEQKIADGEKDLEELEVPTWYVSDRSVLPENTGYGENADRMANLARVIPLLFFIVAALISLTTMTRMVEEERTQIGTLKALGYSKMAIASKYMKYALYATLGGSIFGVLVGEKIFPLVIIKAYGIMYQHLPKLLLPYNLEFALIASAAALICTLGATFAACFRELLAVPAALMRPPTPKEGKRVFLERIPFLWKHMSFTWKSTVRNLLRYKKRFLMTIMGIGGCMGLLLIGFGLQDSIRDIANLQFDNLQLYDAMVIVDTDASGEEQQEVKELLNDDERVDASTRFYVQQMDVQTAGTTRKEWSVYLYVPEDMAQFNEFIHLQDRRTKQSYELTDEGAVLTEKLADELNLQAGDTITLKQEEGEDIEVPILAVCENYLSHYLYMTPALYERLYGESPEYNAILWKSEEDETTIEKIGESLLKKDVVLNITYTGTLAEQLDNMLGAMDIVMIVIIVSAGMLAFVVLYNLNNININERRRELATLKVLGFFDGEVAAYVYRENILLTIIGAILGIFLGKLLHMYVITTVEVDACMFGRNINVSSFVIGTLFTIGFSVIVNFAMYFKLKKIDMVESLKSIE